MRHVALVLIAMVALAMQNTIIAKLRLSGPVIMLCNLILVLFACGMCCNSDMKWPKHEEWIWWALCGLLITITSFCVTTAYYRGASVAEVMSLMALTPIIATLLGLVWMRMIPSRGEVCSMLLAVSAVLVMAWTKWKT